MLERAIALAVKAHEGQSDKAGAPYVLHPLRLMLRMKSDTAMIAAVLHDVIEDTDWTPDRLRSEGFDEELLTILDCLTRRANESYEEFIERVQCHPVAREVKLADLEDNMNIRRFAAFAAEDGARLEKYHRAWRKLTENSAG